MVAALPRLPNHEVLVGHGIVHGAWVELRGRQRADMRRTDQAAVPGQSPAIDVVIGFEYSCSQTTKNSSVSVL